MGVLGGARVLGPGPCTIEVVVVLVIMALRIRLRLSGSQARVYIQRVLLTITGPGRSFYHTGITKTNFDGTKINIP